MEGKKETQQAGGRLRQGPPNAKRTATFSSCFLSQKRMNASATDAWKKVPEEKVIEFQRIQHAVKRWIEQILHIELAEENLHGPLKNGVVLCYLMKKLDESLIPRISEGTTVDQVTTPFFNFLAFFVFRLLYIFALCPFPPFPLSFLPRQNYRSMLHHTFKQANFLSLIDF